MRLEILNPRLPVEIALGYFFKIGIYKLKAAFNLEFVQTPVPEKQARPVELFRKQVMAESLLFLTELSPQRGRVGVKLLYCFFVKILVEFVLEEVVEEMMIDMPFLAVG
jgi:hypothetical protein